MHGELLPCDWQSLPRTSDYKCNADLHESSVYIMAELLNLTQDHDGAVLGLCSRSQDVLQAGEDPTQVEEAGTHNEAAIIPMVSHSSSAPAKGRKKKGTVIFDYSQGDYEVVEECAVAREWRVVKNEEQHPLTCNVIWIDKADVDRIFPSILPWMHVNHWPGMNNSLARKCRMARNLSRVAKHFQKEFRFLPPTWILPDDMNELERKFNDDGDSSVIYIVKPDHMCQGRGIFLTKSIDKIRKCGACRDNSYVVQRYISSPMLLDGFKFDLRLYFLVCGVTVDSRVDLRCFLFDDGLVRLCTMPYEAPTEETLNDKCMHLTNYAVNKKNANFRQPDDGNDGTSSKRSINWFMAYVEREFGERAREKLWQNLGELCVKMVLSVAPTLEAEYNLMPKDLREGQKICRCFELLGVDVMLDWKRRPYLIEVNHLPSFTCDSKLDADIKKRVVEQTLELACGDVLASDKQTYEVYAKEKRFRGSTSTSESTQDVELPHVPVTILDSPRYKDFQRVYPALDTLPRHTEQFERILQHVTSRSRSVLSTRRPSDIHNKESTASPNPKPPRMPPKSPALRTRQSPHERPARPLGPTVRSKSVPPRGLGPPRCAMVGLPQIERGLSSCSFSSTTSLRASVRRASSMRQRILLPMKCQCLTF